MTTIDLPSLPSTPGGSSISGLPASISAARGALATATADYLAIPDEALEREWIWRGGELDVRYGIYRAAETVQAATAELDAVLAGSAGGSGAAGAVRPMAARLIAPATITRWALQGRLASLDDAILDRVAKEGEWTVREVLAHTIDGQRSYGWFTRWWISLPLGPDRPARVTDDVEEASKADLPGEDAEGAGTLPEIRARLDHVLDEWGLRLGSTTDEGLAAPARWSNTPVDVAHRLGRWGSHIAEHTIQLDKTLDWLDYRPREVERIVRELHAAWGRLESRLFPAASTIPEVDAILARVATTLTTEARSTRAAAEA